MSSNIFCPSCGTTILNNSDSCKCGHVLKYSEKNEITQKVNQVNSLVFIDNHSMNLAITSYNNLNNYELDSRYFMAFSAKEDFEKKTDFIQNNLIPNINNWREIIQKGEQQLAIDKIEVYGRILNITDFILKEFYNPFKIKESGLLEFNEYRDFSQYELLETMVEANLDFSDIQKTDFGTVGNNIMSSVESTLRTGSFKQLKNKSEWSKDDVKQIKTEVGFAVATELISGITNAIGENVNAIKAIREADENLNDKIQTISNVMSSLRIEQEELKKFKNLFDKSDVILDMCFNNILKPIVNELKQDPLYIEYRRMRVPFDLQQQKISLDEQMLSISTNVSFWRCLTGTAKTNFKKHWRSRMNSSNNLSLYKEVSEKLNEQNHLTLDELYTYKDNKTDEFRSFEETIRQQLNTRPVIKNNSNKVKAFVQVLRNVKSNITVN